MAGSRLEPAAILFMLERLQESTRWSGCFLLVIFHVIISIGILESNSLSLSTGPKQWRI